jgi:hypothetical protein
MIGDGINSGKRFIHYDPDRTDYAVSEEELVSLQSAGSNLWKDVVLVLGGLGIPSLINAIHDTTEPFLLSAALFLNYFVGVLSILLAFIFGIPWYRSSGQTKSIIERIKAKPRHELTPSATNVGALISQTEIREKVDG